MAVPPLSIQRKILFSLRANSPQATGILARRLRLDRNVALLACRELQRKGFVYRQKPDDEGVLYFFPLTREVLNADNYERITSLNDKLKELLALCHEGKLTLRDVLKKFAGEEQVKARLKEADSCDAIEDLIGIRPILKWFITKKGRGQLP